MFSCKATLALSLVAAMVVAAVWVPAHATVSVRGTTATPSSFTFGAAGSIGSSVNGKKTLDRLAGAGTDFFVALGDLSMNKTGSERNWAGLVKSKLGSSYPFEVLSGDNEDNGPNGLIDNFATNLTNQVPGVVGTYGKEYYFDYPSEAPLARFILISPKLTFTYGGSYTYTVANTHLLWLAAAVDSARATGIPWVVVGMHTGCLSVGSTGCDMGQDLLDLLTIKRVDLVLQGHDATYQRTKPLDCAVRGYFVPDCVADEASDGDYPAGAGTIFVMTGIGGNSISTVRPTDAENPYFARAMGKNVNGWGYGYVRYSVSAGRIDAQTDFNGTWSDAFALVKPSATSLMAGFSVTPGQPVFGEAAAFAADISGGTPPYSVSWTFGDGAYDHGVRATHAYGAAGDYSVVLQVQDASAQMMNLSRSLTVSSRLPKPDLVFAAAGDIGSTVYSGQTLTRLGRSGAEFFIAVGDLSTNGTGSEYPWSVFVKSKVGATYPFEIVSGNHEDTGTRDGLIDNFATDLPDRMNATGVYGKEYYFDAPSNASVARFILISPGLTFSGTTWKYAAGDAHYDWLVKAIDGARAIGIPWVIVAMHKPCISTAGGCEANQDLQDLYSIKKVDLVLSGHQHSYQRSKGLTCALRNYYVPSCVAEDGASGLYAKGAGTIFQIEGIGGQGMSSVSKTDGDYNYFTSAQMGKNTPGYGYGFLTYEVRRSRMDIWTNFSGAFSDRFLIAQSGENSGSVSEREPVVTPPQNGEMRPTPGSETATLREVLDSASAAGIALRRSVASVWRPLNPGPATDPSLQVVTFRPHPTCVVSA